MHAGNNRNSQQNYIRCRQQDKTSINIMLIKRERKNYAIVKEEGRL